MFCHVISCSLKLDSIVFLLVHIDTY
jgi:hypothetical protein